MEGILLALIPMVSWGSIIFVSSKIGGNANQQTFGMTLGAFVFALVVFAVRQPKLDLTTILIGLVGGGLWSIGQNEQFKAAKFMGVSVAGPLSSGAQLVIGSLIGVLAFGEWSKPIQYLLGSIAIIVLVIGFYFSSRKDPNIESVSGQQHLGKGLRSIAYSTFGYVLYATLFNNLSELIFHVKIDTLTVILPMSVGMMIGAWIIAGGKIKLEPVVFKNIPVGLMWGLGNVFMLLAAAKAGLAIAFSFSQLGIIISTIGGILFLGEKKTKLELRYVVIGTALFIIGAILLAIVKIQ
ncbi:GRP family sugar transporter [Lactococcus carnosus]|uniref:EamA family transporter n=1 Tax=Pseudolactococcus carnosus TaxID=2749961 RepID=A0ABT0AUU9_9LACT|nr:GRP family sugar transporter [Lactococcus carnosus]SCA92970.1 putative sugar uptake protein YxfA [Lactococcus piscium]MCJ1969918.1 EamA family transporter [Lactococcus carnosus]MCJ1973949.1 EamA family transporter [Lactococcus carnosus]MCJ1981864.1 EamA family transporter [Lactococcus carnosus]MCJ1990462.1 EamA family transporter [Lactococcus carnosus]